MSAARERDMNGAGVAPWRRWARLCRGLVLGVWLPWATAASCGGQTGASFGTDTSTNWLRSCSDDVECGLGSTCSCGRCTRECSADAECADYSSVAVCEQVAGQCGDLQLCVPAPRTELTALGEPLPSCTHPAEDYVLTVPAECFSRQLAECPPGSEPFFDTCGCGCSTAPDYPRRCRSQCELAAGDCEDLRFEAMPDYAATLELWSGLDDFSALVAGQCSNGRSFVYTANGTTSEARFFAPNGQFLGLGTTTDDIEQTCWGQSYWPEAVRCEQATITLVVNSGLGLQEEGQVVQLPWAEGPPEPFF